MRPLCNRIIAQKPLISRYHLNKRICKLTIIYLYQNHFILLVKLFRSYQGVHWLDFFCYLIHLLLRPIFEGCYSFKVTLAKEVCCYNPIACNLLQKHIYKSLFSILVSDEPLQSVRRVVFTVGGDHSGGVHRLRPECSPP